MRARLVEANKAAAAFYTAQLQSPEAQIGRRFLEERGFDRDAAERFGVGYAPQGWNGLTDHLRAAGFTDQELLGAGLVVEGKRGVYDRFRGRLTWAIRDIGGDTVGFGARRLYDTDEGPKYLNTPETSVYKKSQVLYGIEFAKRAIAKQQQAVVVEGYTDVMACHLSGVETAVATCGTAFGEEHIKVLRRLLMDDSAFTGQVVFTFDGDAAGQKAALRAFDDEQKFVAQTFVAVEPGGLDPCELRQQKGPEAVRGLVDARVPLVEFAIRSAVRSHDLDHAEGRIAALRAGAPLVARIKDRSLRPEYARLLAGWIGMEAPPVLAAVSAAERRGPQTATTRERAPAPVNTTATEGDADAAAAEPVEPPIPRPNPREPRLAVEREALKLAHAAPRPRGRPARRGRRGGFLASRLRRAGPGRRGRRAGARAPRPDRRGSRPCVEPPTARSSGRWLQSSRWSRCSSPEPPPPATPRSRSPGSRSARSSAASPTCARGSSAPTPATPRRRPPCSPRSLSWSSAAARCASSWPAEVPGPFDAWRRGRPPDAARSAVPAGERLLAWGACDDGALVVATDRSLVLPEPGGSMRAVRWESVAQASWQDERLEVVESGGGGQGRRTTVLSVLQPGALPEALRERVTATIVVSEHVDLVGERGARITARRSPGGSDLTWVVTFDAGLDARDPALREAADAAVARLKGQVE